MPIDVSVQLTIYVLHFSTDGADGIHDRCVVLRVFATELQQNRSNDATNCGDQRCENNLVYLLKNPAVCCETDLSVSPDDVLFRMMPSAFAAVAISSNAAAAHFSNLPPADTATTISGVICEGFLPLRCSHQWMSRTGQFGFML